MKAAFIFKLLDNFAAYLHQEWMNNYWKISASRLSKLVIVFSLLFSFNASSHASVSQSTTSVTHEVNHAEGCPNSLRIIIDLSDIISPSKHSENSGHQKMPGNDTGSCCQTFCAAFYVAEFAPLVNLYGRDIHSPNIDPTIFFNRLDVPHRPPNT